MKQFIITIVALATVTFCGCVNTSTQKEHTLINSQEAAMSIEKTYQFLKNAKTYFIATTENDQPRVRPFGTIHIFENKLYIQTGRKKNVAKQLLANGKTELCAFNGTEWIRVSGTLVDDNRREAKVSMLDEYPSLKAMYSPDDDNTMVLYFKPGTVTSIIYSFKVPPVVMNF